MINHNAIAPIPGDAKQPRRSRRVFLTLEKSHDADMQYNANKRTAIGLGREKQDGAAKQMARSRLGSMI